MKSSTRQATSRSQGSDANSSTIQVLLAARDTESLTEMFRYFRHQEVELTRCRQGAEALRQVATGRFDLLVCEKNLSDLSSTDLLQVIKNKFPWVRMVVFADSDDPVFAADARALGLDGFLDLSAAVDAIPTVLSAVLASLDSKSGDPGLRDDLLTALRSLPAVPKVIIKLWEYLDSGEDALHRAVSIVRTDPGLTAMILRVANSVRYGSRQRIRSLESAISLMGLAELRSLSIVHSARQVFRGSLQSRGGFNLRDYWSHSVRVALTAERLTRKVTGVPADFAFSAGLLHDLGLLALAEVYKGSYDRIASLISSGAGPRFLVESDVLGIDHARAGGIVCRHWNLPDYLFEPIRYHHEPLEAVEDKRLTALIHLADYLVHLLDDTDGGIGDLPHSIVQTLDQLSMTPADLLNYLNELPNHLAESSEPYRDLLAVS